ncbi:hypothetical protein [Ehrlichia chaffeensis]|uniref:hypothetical protein n=1 Tax=Ehrlichia chaffeensis TaxID=945 RepID=UPI000444BA1A|nr:hypothetical protein [Ehrlichia chaffeensis]AHX08904.1 hypothetical protein ECHSTV_0168 [Ehrlichia chaffeensis str. Saint Vincent]
MRNLQKPIVSATEISYNQEVIRNEISILNAYSINFIRKNDTVFSAYYVKRGVVVSDLICEISHGNSTYRVKVNDNAVLDRTIEHYLPEMLLVKGLGNDFLIVVLSEGVLREYKLKSTLSLKIYRIHYSPITLFDMGKIRLSSSIDSLKEEVKYPVILYQSQVDSIVIVGRVDNDARAKLPDRFYVMWRIQYRDNKFQLIKPVTREAKFNTKYLFKYSGYIGYGKYSDKLIMVSESKKFLNLLYVGKYLNSNHKFFSSIYEISVDYTLNLNIEECVVNRRYGCNVPDDVKYHIPVSGINVIAAIRNEENTYIAYVGIVPNSKFKDSNQLIVVHSKAGNQLSIYDFMQIKEHVTSLYVRYIRNNIVVTAVGADNIVRYEIPELQLRSGNITYVNVMQFSRHEITNIVDFTNVVIQDISLESMHADIRGVEAKKTYNNYAMYMFFNIREIQSKDVFAAVQNRVSSVNSTSVYETTTSTYMTTHNLFEKSTEINSTLYDFPMISSTTQSAVLSTNRAENSIENVTNFVGNTSIPTDTRRDIMNVTKIPMHFTTVKRTKFTSGKKHISNASDVEYSILGKRAKYNVKSTTQSSAKRKSTIRKHVFYDEDLETTSDYAVTDRLNITTANVSRLDSFLLTNNNISRSKVYSVDHSFQNNGLLVGAIFIVVLFVILFVGIFYNRSGCNRLRRNFTMYMNNRRSGTHDVRELQVFELSNRQEIAGVRISSRSAYGNRL